MRLIEQGTLDAARADAIAEEARQEMEAAVQFGLDSPFPEPEAALKHAYA
jgi:pyruvate dehydrogenase E1 component alpha subunit